MKKQIGVIDVTPTWRGVVPMLAEVAINGTSFDGRNAAMSELKRLASIADRHVKAANQIKQLWESL